MNKWKKLIFWIGTLAAVFVIVTAGYYWSKSKQLERKLTALKEAGEPICLADLARKPIPPDQNGATYLRRVQSDLESVDKELSSLIPEDGRNNAEDIKKIEDVHNSYPNIYPLLIKVAVCPDFDMQMDFTLTPNKFLEKSSNDKNTYAFRSSARYLAARAEVLLSKGKRNEAMQSTILMLQLSRQFGREPSLIDYLVSVTIGGMALESAHETLQTGPVSDQIRAALDAELCSFDSMESCRRALKAERAFTLDSFRYELPHPWILSDIWQLSVLNSYEEFLDYSFQPFSDWVAKDDIQQSKPRSSFNILAELITPSFRSALVFSYRFQAQVRALRILNALQRKNPADGKKIPTMAELGLPDEVGIDPFNGKPMVIKKLPEGWLVYSVGENLKDDGGKFENMLDVGFRPKTSKEEAEGKEPIKLSR